MGIWPWRRRSPRGTMIGYGELSIRADIMLKRAKLLGLSKRQAIVNKLPVSLELKNTLLAIKEKDLKEIRSQARGKSADAVEDIARMRAESIRSLREDKSMALNFDIKRITDDWLNALYLIEHLDNCQRGIERDGARYIDDIMITSLEPVLNGSCGAYQINTAEICSFRAKRELFRLAEWIGMLTTEEKRELQEALQKRMQNNVLERGNKGCVKKG